MEDGKYGTLFFSRPNEYDVAKCVTYLDEETKLTIASAPSPNSQWQLLVLRAQQGCTSLLCRRIPGDRVLAPLAVHVRLPLLEIGAAGGRAPWTIVVLTGATSSRNDSHYKCFKLTFLYVICAALFLGGFVLREVGAFHYDSLVLYIVSVCLIYAAP